MDVDIYYDFIEPIDLNNEFEIYETYNVKQLAVRVKLFHKLKKEFNDHIKNAPKTAFITEEQRKNKIKFLEYLDEYYPIKDVSDKKEETNKIIRTRELKKFNNTCHSNNKMMTDDDVLKKITEIIKSKSYFDAKAYANEQIACECGCISYRKNLSTHKKSKLHEKRLAEVNKLMEEEMA
jgi:hypothetical protein